MTTEIKPSPCRHLQVPFGVLSIAVKTGAICANRCITPLTSNHSLKVELTRLNAIDLPFGPLQRCRCQVGQSPLNTLSNTSAHTTRMR